MRRGASGSSTSRTPMATSSRSPAHSGVRAGSGDAAAPRARAGARRARGHLRVKLSRRALLTLAGLAALGVTVPACRQMLWQILFSPDATGVPPLPQPGNPFRAGGKSLVALVRGDDVPRMVRRALDLLGGPGQLDLAGRRVLVKPNVVSGEPAPAATDPRVGKVVAE